MKINLGEDHEADPPETPALDAALDAAYDNYLDRWAEEILAQAKTGQEP